LVGVATNAFGTIVEICAATAPASAVRLKPTSPSFCTVQLAWGTPRETVNTVTAVVQEGAAVAISRTVQTGITAPNAVAIAWAGASAGVAAGAFVAVVDGRAAAPVAVAVGYTWVIAALATGAFTAVVNYRCAVAYPGAVWDTLGICFFGLGRL